MKNIILILLASTSIIYAQNLKWVSTIGSNADDGDVNLNIFKNGDLVLCGHIGTATNLTNLNINNNLNNLDIYNESIILRTDSNRNTKWYKRYYNNWLPKCTIDDFNNTYYIADSIGSNDIIIRKMRSNGIVVWTKYLNSPNLFINKAKTNSKGSLILTGKFKGTVDFDPNVNVVNKGSTDAFDLFVLNLDSNGVFNWIFTDGKGHPYTDVNPEDSGEDIFIDKNDNIYVTGRIEYPSFQTSTPNFYTMHNGVYYNRLTNNGIPTSTTSQTVLKTGAIGKSIYVDSDSTVYITGDKSMVNNRNWFVSKLKGFQNLNSTLYSSLKWNFVFGNTTTKNNTGGIASKIILNSCKDIVVYGSFKDTLLFPNSMKTPNKTGAYQLTLDTGSNFISFKSLNDSGRIEISDVVYYNNHTFISGLFSGKVDYDFSLNENIIFSIPHKKGGFSDDIFIAKYQDSLCTIKDPITSNENTLNNSQQILIYPNPANSHINIRFNNFNSDKGYSIKILNSLSQEVYAEDVTKQETSISASSIGGTGMYFIQFIDNSSNIVETKKLILE